MQTRSQAAKENLQTNEGDNKQTDNKSVTYQASAFDNSTPVQYLGARVEPSQV